MTRFAFLACVLLVSSAAFAAEPVVPADNLQSYTAQILKLNQIPPAQNPQYSMGSKVSSFRLLDSNRRALGKINDITLGADGSMQSVQADVLSTGFDQELSFGVVAHNVTPESDAYSVTLTRDQVEENLPEFLAATESAAGEDGTAPVTVQSLIGARVQTGRGSQVAMVDDVVIDDQQKMAVALLLTLMGGTGHATIAVPYRDAKITRNGQKATVEISDEQAKIVSNYALKR